MLSRNLSAFCLKRPHGYCAFVWLWVKYLWASCFLRQSYRPIQLGCEMSLPTDHLLGPKFQVQPDPRSPESLWAPSLTSGWQARVNTPPQRSLQLCLRKRGIFPAMRLPFCLQIHKFSFMLFSELWLNHSAQLNSGRGRFNFQSYLNKGHSDLKLMI